MEKVLNMILGIIVIALTPMTMQGMLMRFIFWFYKGINIFCLVYRPIDCYIIEFIFIVILGVLQTGVFEMWRKSFKRGD